MSRLKLRALAGACALAGASALTSVADAQAQILPTPSPVSGSTGTLDGSGSSLIAPFWAQAQYCLDSINAAPAPEATSGKYYLKGAPVDAFATAPLTGADACTPLNSGVIGMNVVSTDLGVGVLYAHSFVAGTAQQTAFAGQLGTAPGSTVVPLYPQVDYALSEIGLMAADLAVYTSGGTEQGFTFVAPGVTPNPATPTFANPSSTYGPLIQFPVSIDPVALAYNPTYESSNGSIFALQVKTSLQNSDGSGGLHLSAAAYCGIFNGVITDWGDATLTALNGGQSLKSLSDTGTSAPIRLVGQANSGTTAIFTRHLANVCAALAGTVLPDGQTLTNTYATGAPTLANAGVGAPVLGLFTLGTGNLGAAGAIAAAPGAIGYVGPDYALPYVVHTGADAFSLNVADLQNASAAGGVFVEPSPAAATAAFGSIAPPTGVGAGVLTNWVQGTAPSVPLANPQAAGSYPIVGTTNFVAHTCYASAGSVTALTDFFTFASGTTGATILKNAGLAPMPNSWITQIADDFFIPNAAGLFIAVTGPGSANPVCA